MGSRQSSLNVLNRDDSHPSRRGTTTNPREGVDCRSDLQVLSLLPTASRRPVRAFLPFLRVRICLFQFIFALTSVQLPRETCIISRNTCAGAWPTRRRQGTPFALTRVHFDKADARNFIHQLQRTSLLFVAHNNSAVALARYTRPRQTGSLDQLNWHARCSRSAGALLETAARAQCHCHMHQPATIHIHTNDELIAGGQKARQERPITEIGSHPTLLSSRLVATEIPRSLIRGLAENPVQNCALFLLINHQNVEDEGI